MSPRYQIRVEGHLEPRWSEWLDGMQITQLKNGETLLSGQVVDQTALHGLLAKLRDLNLKLVAVNKQGNGDVSNSGMSIHLKRY